MPDEHQLPPGPRRNLVAALHGLYELAGKPSARSISGLIREGDLPGTFSHEGVSAVLRGAGRGVPRWENLESLVRVLVEQRRIGQAEPDAVVAKIHALWVHADGGPSVAHTVPTGLSAKQEDVGPASVRVAADDLSVHGHDDKLTAEEHAPVPILRWRTRHVTVDVFDRQMAVEFFKEAGGVND